MGVTAISIGFGAVFPSMNLIAKPFVCPNGKMDLQTQTYNPYPGNTITTLTWYCVDQKTGTSAELGIFSMSLYAGLIYGFLLFVVIYIFMFIRARRSVSAADNPALSAPMINSTVERDMQFQERSGQFLNSASGFGTQTMHKTQAATDALSRMKELKQLRADNLISEAEYQEKRSEILKTL
jgi:hypothetical protein